MGSSPEVVVCADLEEQAEALCLAAQKEPHLRVDKDVQRMAQLSQFLPFFCSFSHAMRLNICKVRYAPA